MGCRDGDARISVAFEPTVPLTAIAEPNDGPFFWSGAENNSVASLERVFNLPGDAVPIRFSFSIRYDLEPDYDYLYLLASIDDGANWRVLPLPGGQEDRTAEFSLGNGLSGWNGDWERMELNINEVSVLAPAMEAPMAEAIPAISSSYFLFSSPFCHPFFN